MYDIKDVTDVSRVFSVLLCSVEVRLATANTNQQIQTKDSTKMIATVNPVGMDQIVSFPSWWQLTETSSRHDGGTELSYETEVWTKKHFRLEE